MSTDCTAQRFLFQGPGRREIVASFNGGRITSEGGVVLLERVPRAKRNAVVICVLKAYRKARATWRDGEALDGDERDSKVREEIVA